MKALTFVRARPRLASASDESVGMVARTAFDSNDDRARAFVVDRYATALV